MAFIILVTNVPFLSSATEYCGFESLVCNSFAGSISWGLDRNAICPWLIQMKRLIKWLLWKWGQGWGNKQGLGALDGRQKGGLQQSPVNVSSLRGPCQELWLMEQSSYLQESGDLSSSHPLISGGCQSQLTRKLCCAVCKAQPHGHRAGQWRAVEDCWGRQTG